MYEAITFYSIAAAVAGCALGCVIATNIVRMAMCLLGTLGGVALLYFLLSANFLGVIQLIVYAGGTLIVIVFGVMLTSRSFGSKLRPKPFEAVVAALVCIALLVSLSAIFVDTQWRGGANAAHDSFGVAAFGDALLSTYLVPFEIASVLLLAVMIGAAYLAQPEPKRPGPDR
jgi:NADH-quinone oxidoreductase subunit J